MELRAVSAAPVDSLDRLLWNALEACEQPLAVVEVRHPDRPLIWVNGAYERLTGYKRSELLGRNPKMLQVAGTDGRARQRLGEAIAQGLPATATLLNRRKDGSLFFNHIKLNPLPGAAATPQHYVGLAQCVGELSAPDQAQLLDWIDVGEHEWHLLERLTQALGRAQANAERLAFLLLQSDASTNPDGLIRRLVTLGMPHRTHVLPLGEASFGLLIEAAPAFEALAGLAHELLAGLLAQAPRCAIGICFGPDDGETAVALQIAAQQALQRAIERSPEGGLAFFAAHQDASWREGHLLQRDLRQALAEGSNQFRLLYQPVIELEGGWLVGFEALVRWEHPLRGTLGPDLFIPLAESGGLICALGDWVLDAALRELKAINRLTLRPLRMAVNVSAQQLHRADFAERLQALLQAHAIAPTQLELEITERSVSAGDPQIEACLHQLRRLNVRLAIDDFGTGYSNLHGLTRLPADVLKIDRSLTQSAVHSGSALSVARMVCELARALHLQVVAEGIENSTELALFQRFGAAFGQGFLVSRPVPAEEARQLVQRQQPLAAGRDQDEQPHLLLLDDEAHIISALQRSFRREPWKVHGTTSPEEAMRLLAQHPIGVVLCDQRMPEMNGTEFLRQVHLSHPKVVRVLLSGYSEISAVTAAINEGAVWRVLSKPWDDAELRQQIRLAFDLFRQSAEAERQQREADQQSHTLLAQLERQREQLAREAEALDAARSSLLDLPVPLLGLDPQGTIVLSNEAADRLFGQGLPLIGASLDACLPPALSQLLAQGGELNWQGRRYTAHVQPMHGTAGRLLCLTVAA